MSGNFWKSSHYEQWLLERGDLLRDRGEDLKTYSEEEYQKLMIFFTNFIYAMGQCMEKEVSQPINEHSKDKPILRVQAIATACVYFRRFYSRRSFRDIDPFLLAVTCINLASKVEEMGHLSPNKLLTAWAKAAKKWPQIESLISQHQPSTHQIKGSEAEFCLVEMLDCSLIVYHPYRPLLQFRNDMKSLAIQNVDQLCQDAWRLCNDSLRGDVALLYPPHLIAIAAIITAAILNGREKEKEKELRNWLAELNVDFEKIFEIQQMLFQMYRVWRSFDEQAQLRGLVERLPRPCHAQQSLNSQPLHMQ